MNYGFVTGLPRSGSAWLANYLSYGNCMFLHDAWLRTTPVELKQSLNNSSNYAAGTVDPYNAIVYDKIDKEFPEAKWVVITRASKDVEDSCRSIKFPFVKFTEQLQSLMSNKDVLKISFKQMFSQADEIGRFIYPEWECPKWRRDMLQNMNVQLHFDKVSEQFSVPGKLKEIPVVTPDKMEYFRLIKEITNGDSNAIRFLAQAREASELYRRLDQGKMIDVIKAKEILEAMATEWMVSPFINQFSKSLAPAIIACMEKYQNDPNTPCPVDIDLVTTVVYIFRGNDGVKEFMPRIRELSNKIKENECQQLG